MIDQRKWKWFGHHGHFICGPWCRFHLCTQVGPWLVSTVGEYVPDEGTREVLARTRGIALEGCGDARLSEWLKKNGFEKLGCGLETYETMVFHAGPPCRAKGCNCGIPIPTDYMELECRRWMTAGAATKGHYQLCHKWSSKRIGDTHDQA